MKTRVNDFLARLCLEGFSLQEWSDEEVTFRARYNTGENAEVVACALNQMFSSVANFTPMFIPGVGSGANLVKVDLKPDMFRRIKAKLKGR